jgi:hypothetical protein
MRLFLEKTVVFTETPDGRSGVDEGSEADIDSPYN